MCQCKKDHMIQVFSDLPFIWLILGNQNFLPKTFHVIPSHYWTHPATECIVPTKGHAAVIL